MDDMKKMPPKMKASGEMSCQTDCTKEKRGGSMAMGDHTGSED